MVYVPDSSRGGSSSSALTPFPQAFKSGRYYRANSSPVGGTSNALTLNRLYLLPFVCPVSRTFDRIALFLSTAAAAGGVARYGAYASDSEGLPSTLIVDAGTVAIDAGPGTIKEATVSLSVTTGLVWLAVAQQVAAGGTIFGWVAAVPGVPGIALTTTDSAGDGYYQDAVAGALPATLALTSYMNVIHPGIWLRAA